MEPQLDPLPYCISTIHLSCVISQIEDKGGERGLSIDMESHAIKLKKKNTPKQFGVL